jgi:phosphoserine phosphatase RsbU/P
VFAEGLAADAAARSPFSVLLLEDSLPDAELVGVKLEELASGVEVFRVDSRSSFLEALEVRPWDIVLADYSVPSFDGAEALAAARVRWPLVPFIFVTGALGDERAIELLKLGATDYVLKDRLERLGSSVLRALAEAREKADRKRAEEALRESERTLKTLIGNMPGMAFRCPTTDPWVFAYASVGARELTGYDPEAFYAGGPLTWLSIVHPDDRDALVGAARAAAARGEQRSLRYRIRARSGAEKWVWDRAVGIADVAGGPAYIEGFVTDVTDQMRAQAEAERRAELEQQLIGIVSHDLRNPLNVILLATAAALTNEELDPGVARLLLRIKSAGDRAERMIRDLLDFTQARLGAGIHVDRGRTDLRQVVAQVVEEAETTRPGRRIEVEHAGVGGSEGEWDPDRLAQVVSNLVVNALRHGDSDAAVTVRTRGAPDVVVLEVHNRGEPIASELQARLFQPLQRGTTADRASRSVGLGLYIVDQIVKSHGGAIEVESSREEGTTFRVSLPRRAPGESP